MHQMTALIVETTALRVAGRKIAMQVVGAVAALGLVTACTTSDSGGPSNQAMGTFMGAAVGGAVGGLAFGSAGGVIGGSLVGALGPHLLGRGPAQQGRARPAQASQSALLGHTHATPTSTVRPTTSSATPASGGGCGSTSGQRDSLPGRGSPIKKHLPLALAVR